MRESFRAWTKDIETFCLDVIFGQRRGYVAGFMRGILFSFSKVFQVLVGTRRVLYNRLNR